MDTRPWRLNFPNDVRVHWFDVDLPVLVDVKRRLLEQAGAQTTGTAASAACHTGTVQQHKPAAYTLRTASYQSIGKCPCTQLIGFVTISSRSITVAC